MKVKRSKKVKMGARHFAIAFLLFLTIFVAAGLLVNGLGGIKLFSHDEKSKTAEEFHLLSIVDSDNPFFETYSDSKRINVLLLGINPPLTDTIILASFDPDQKKADLISVPRDTYYPREGADGDSQKKINAAYHGEAINTARAVSDVLQGMPIHYYAVVDFKGVENIVEAMGGVPVNVPFHMYYTDPYDDPPLTIDIPAGEQTLDGEDAIKFLRFRHGNKGYPQYPMQDLDRNIAQQEFLKSAFVQSMGHLPSVIKSVHSNVKSNVDLKTALSIAGKAAGMGGEDIASHSLPGESKRTTTWYFMQDVEATKTMIEEIYKVPETATEGAVAEE